jgi:Fur family transcriptional regulator, stress-responsive regulator
MPPENFAALLRATNLRVTGPRVAVLELLARRPHVQADTILRDLRARSSAVSHQAVYDVLSALTAAGLVRRIAPAGQPALYERRTGDNHHHVVCRRCGRVEDVDCVIGHAPCLVASDDLGFVLDEAEVTWWGVCPGCATTSVL